MNVRVTKKTKKKKKKNDLSVSIDFILGSILGCTKCKERREEKNLWQGKSTQKKREAETYCRSEKQPVGEIGGGD